MFTPYLAPARLQTCITSAEALVLEDGCILRSSFSGVQSTCIPPTVVAVGYYSYALGISYPDPKVRLGGSFEVCQQLDTMLRVSAHCRALIRGFRGLVVEASPPIKLLSGQIRQAHNTHKLVTGCCSAISFPTIK